MHRRVRWENVLRVAGASLLVAAVVAWPRLAPPEPELPAGDAAPLVAGDEPREGGERAVGSREGRDDGGRRPERSGDGGPGGERRGAHRADDEPRQGGLQGDERRGDERGSDERPGDERRGDERRRDDRRGGGRPQTTAPPPAPVSRPEDTTEPRPPTPPEAKFGFEKG
jgi:hypothetical protein